MGGGLCIWLSVACPICQVLHVCLQVCYPLLEDPPFSSLVCDIFRISVLVAVAGFEGLEAACGMNKL